MLTARNLLHLPADLMHRTAALAALTESMRSGLPPLLAPYTWVAGHDGSTLFVLVESGARATELRYLQREILKRINSDHGLGLKKAVIRAVPQKTPPIQRHTPPPPLSTAAAESLESAASGVSDPRLANALRRLAARAKA